MTRSSQWLSDLLTDLLTDWLTDSLTHFKTHTLTDCSFLFWTRLLLGRKRLCCSPVALARSLYLLLLAAVCLGKSASSLIESWHCLFFLSCSHWRVHSKTTSRLLPFGRWNCRFHLVCQRLSAKISLSISLPTTTPWWLLLLLRLLQPLLRPLLLPVHLLRRAVPQTHNCTHWSSIGYFTSSISITPGRGHTAPPVVLCQSQTYTWHECDSQTAAANQHRPAPRAPPPPPPARTLPPSAPSSTPPPSLGHRSSSSHSSTVLPIGRHCCPFLVRALSQLYDPSCPDWSSPSSSKRRLCFITSLTFTISLNPQQLANTCLVMFETLPLQRHEHTSQKSSRQQLSRHVPQCRIAVLCHQKVSPIRRRAPTTPPRSTCSMPRRHPHHLHPLLYIVLVLHLLATSSLCLTLDAPSLAKYQVSFHIFPF